MNTRHYRRITHKSHIKLHSTTFIPERTRRLSHSPKEAVSTHPWKHLINAFPDVKILSKCYFWVLRYYLQRVKCTSLRAQFNKFLYPCNNPEKNCKIKMDSSYFFLNIMFGDSSVFLHNSFYAAVR